MQVCPDSKPGDPGLAGKGDDPFATVVPVVAVARSDPAERLNTAP